MMFFDEQGNRIQYQQWLKHYEPYYFLNGPKLARRINARNQSSPFVENEVCALLTQAPPLSKQDLILAMAWKIGGLIDHSNSEAKQQIVYLQNWPTTLTATTQYGSVDFSTSIPYLTTKMSTILKQINQGNPQYLFDLVSQLEGFGKVYILTVLFFVTHGKFPIYDRYAHIAAQTIHQGLPPGSYFHHNKVLKWSDYQDYMDFLVPINKACPQQLKNSSMFISRSEDRALWVYGHFFEDHAKGPSSTKTVETHHKALTIHSYFDAILFGRIRDLSQIAVDGWKRREIIIQQRTDGYPRERTSINLIDSSGIRYTLPFIKGAGVQGYTCLGKPGTLKPWFKQHYSVDQVEAEQVYFKPTGQPNEYRIYTESEWKACKP